MGKKQDQQIEGYLESALTGENGVDISKDPTDPTNEHNFEQSQGMSPSEAKEFEEAIQKDLGGERNSED